MTTGVYKRKPFTKEHRENLSMAAKNNPTLKERGRKLGLSNIGRQHTEKSKKNMGLTHIGKKHPHSEETKNKIRVALKGRHLPKKVKIKISNALKGAKCHLWKGGITPIRKLLRTSSIYKQWRQQVFIRDNFICQKCRRKKGDKIVLSAHHITPLHKLMQEAHKHMPFLSWHNACMLYTPIWDTNNGKTLCEDCHLKTKLHRVIEFKPINKTQQ